MTHECVGGCGFESDSSTLAVSVVCHKCGRPRAHDSTEVRDVLLLGSIAPVVFPGPEATGAMVECFHARRLFELNTDAGAEARALLEHFDTCGALGYLPQATFGLVLALSPGEVFFNLQVLQHQYAGAPAHVAPNVTSAAEIGIAMGICALSTLADVRGADFFVAEAKAALDACENLNLSETTARSVAGVRFALAGDLMTSDIDYSRCTRASIDCVTVLAHALAHRRAGNACEAEVLFHLLDPGPEHAVVFPEAFIWGCLRPRSCKGV